MSSYFAGRRIDKIPIVKFTHNFCKEKQMSNFLKLEGITGESGNPRHVGEFDIISVVLGYRIPTRQSLIPKSGKVFGDASVTRKQEEDSNKLLTASITGTVFPGGKITFGSAEIIYMSNVLITAYSLDKSIETLSLSYEVPA